jgi:DNA-binding MarR family transcriptional regulator
MAEEAQGSEMKAIDKLDRLIHEPARLKILTHLHVVESADFVYLMGATGLTRGNLSSHMTKLEEAGYIEVTKQFVDRKPLTLLQLTMEGRKAFQAYRSAMAKVIKDR